MTKEAIVTEPSHEEPMANNVSKPVWTESKDANANEIHQESKPLIEEPSPCKVIDHKTSKSTTKKFMHVLL